jgi:hypothetical protein
MKPLLLGALILTGCQSADMTVHQQAANAEYKRCLQIMHHKRYIGRPLGAPIVVSPSIEDVCMAVRSHVRRTGGAVSYEAIP